MRGVLGILGSLEGASGLLLLCLIVSMLYFAYTSWRTGGGRLALVMLIAALAYGCLEGLMMLARFAAMLFPYTSGGELLWRMLHEGNLFVHGMKTLALLVVVVSFLKLALRARKSRRA